MASSSAGFESFPALEAVFFCFLNSLEDSSRRAMRCWRRWLFLASNQLKELVYMVRKYILVCNDDVVSLQQLHHVSDKGGAGFFGADVVTLSVPKFEDVGKGDGNGGLSAAGNSNRNNDRFRKPKLGLGLGFDLFLRRLLPIVRRKPLQEHFPRLDNSLIILILRKRFRVPFNFLDNPIHVNLRLRSKHLCP